MAEHCREKKMSPCFIFKRSSFLFLVTEAAPLFFLFFFLNHFSGLWFPLCCLSGLTNVEGAVSSRARLY